MKIAREQIKEHWKEFIFILITFGLLLLRCLLHADYFDEIFNLSVAYRISMGQVPFYECWEAYQSGDMFMVPFIWLYTFFRRNTDGIILFSRVIYVISLILCAFATYKLLDKKIDKTGRFYIAYTVVFFQLYGLFYLWYDTSGIIFMYLGLLLICQFCISHKKRFMILAGTSHAFMAFAYPSYLLLIVFVAILQAIYFIKKNNIKNAIFNILLYAIGGGIIAVAFAAYAFFAIGIGPFLEGIRSILSLRGVGQSIASNSIFGEVLACFLHVNGFIVIPTFAALILLGFILKKYNKKLLMVFIFIILLIPLINMLFVIPKYRGLPNYLAYVGLWAPGFYLLIDKQENKKIALNYLIFLWLPSVFSLVSISVSSLPAEIGQIKGWQGFLGCLICIAIEIVLICRERLNDNELSLFGRELFIKIIIGCLILGSYIYTYQNTEKIYQNRELVRSGIYQGLLVTNNMKDFENIEKLVDNYEQEYETIFTGNVYRSAYLMTGMKPCTPLVEGLYWNVSMDYFKKFNKYPDVMVLYDEEVEDEQLNDFLKKNYRLDTDKKFEYFRVLVYVIK